MPGKSRCTVSRFSALRSRHAKDDLAVTTPHPQRPSDMPLCLDFRYDASSSIAQDDDLKAKSRAVTSELTVPRWAGIAKRCRRICITQLAEVWKIHTSAGRIRSQMAASPPFSLHGGRRRLAGDPPIKAGLRRQATWNAQACRILRQRRRRTLRALGTTRSPTSGVQCESHEFRATKASTR